MAIACLDAAYGENAAAVASVLIDAWPAASASHPVPTMLRLVDQTARDALANDGG
jgi:hypothetical protein